MTTKNKQGADKEQRAVSASILRRNPDIEVTGELGFYTLTFLSQRGKAFSDDVQGVTGDTAYCDDSRLTNDIIHGALEYGLTLCVNGRTVWMDKPSSPTTSNHTLNSEPKPAAKACREKRIGG